MEKVLRRNGRPENGRIWFADSFDARGLDFEVDGSPATDGVLLEFLEESFRIEQSQAIMSPAGLSDSVAKVLSEGPGPGSIPKQRRAEKTPPSAAVISSAHQPFKANWFLFAPFCPASPPPLGFSLRGASAADAADGTRRFQFAQGVDGILELV